MTQDSHKLNPQILLKSLEQLSQKYVKGLVNSEVELEYDSEMGDFVSCMDNRYVITNRILHSTEDNASFKYCFIYDAKLNKYESYSCNSYVKGNTLILY